MTDTDRLSGETGSLPSVSEGEPYPGRARVTLVWETDAEFVDSEGGLIRCVGWVHNAEGLIARVLTESPRSVQIETIGATDG